MSNPQKLFHFPLPVMSMHIPRSCMQCLLVFVSVTACSDSGSRQPLARDATSDSLAIALEVSRQTAAADSVQRQTRLRTLQATLDDLATRDSAGLRVEVDLAARRLRVLDERSDTLAQHDVAVGSAEWPTRPGNWHIGQVVLNPEWIPPTEEEWAEDEKPSAPGDPDNPLGHAQLVYDLPRSIHGTNAPSSIGKAVSHGSIRALNEVVLAIAELLMRETGVDRATALVQEAQRDRTTKHVIDLPQLVPIRVY